MSDSDQHRLDNVREGLRMTQPPAPEALAAEKRLLAGVDDAPLSQRLRTYARMIGPGYLQSAMTLGGGTAASALFAGAVFGYELLWVAPVGMVLGVIMLAAISYQTLSTGMRPYEAMARYAGRPLAWAWAAGALLASVIWHFPQYALGSAVLVDMGEAVGLGSLPPMLMSVLILIWAVGLSNVYGGSPRFVRLYERALKYMVWLTVLAFLLVVLRTGVSDWGALLRGLFSFRIPDERNGVLGTTLVLSGMSAAVGINMVFLYPYTLLARGWGREHRKLARFDLYTGTLVPYTIATILIVVAAANTIHLDPAYDGTRLAPVEAARSLSVVIGPTFGRLIFNLGVLAMALSTITLHMLVAGFVCAEVFGWEVGSRRYRLATLIPVPGVLGPLFWSDIAVWLAVPTNILCGLFLPAAYLGFVLLQRSKRYLRDDLPEGTRGVLVPLAMAGVTVFLTAFLLWYLRTNGAAWLEGFW